MLYQVIGYCSILNMELDYGIFSTKEKAEAIKNEIEEANQFIEYDYEEVHVLSMELNNPSNEYYDKMKTKKLYEKWMKEG